MLRSLDSTSCDACPEPAVEVLAIHGAGTAAVLRAVCPAHLKATLRGARMLAPDPPARSESGSNAVVHRSKD